ncbi:NAD(P)H-hydrate dehydratase [Senegalia massiliensis]|uniref:NAD(P)H-hydrate dehydratase n=1 Tax=Senegalia massiliensis TaxID=1720316 RepID=UPI001A91E274|nr:NAD(P)H-hydrate dehydratase [Senegalia massiliensis]
MSVGIDIVKIHRIEDILDKKRDSFLNKIFTTEEKQYIKEKKYSPQTIAGLFSAKESISKAIGTGIGKVSFKDIEISHDKFGKPIVIINEKVKSFGISKIDLTITHEIDYAVSFAKVNFKINDNIIEIPEELKGLLTKRNPESHKGDYGKVLIIGGSRGMTGSVTLSSKSAMRTGSGLVYTMVPEYLETIMSIKLTEEIVKIAKDNGKGYFIKKSLEEILNNTKDKDVLAIGPGMGTFEDNIYLLREIIKNINIPLVIDADGLNSLSTDIDILKNKKNSIVITPHLGEMARLLDKSIKEIENNRVYYAKHISNKYNIVTVLKGSNTIVSYKDEIYINNSGNPGMAKAGSGDVLTGIIISLIGQGLEPFNAAKLAVYIHGLAGDFARDKKGEHSMIASDIVDSIGDAINFLLTNKKFSSKLN